MEGHEGAVDGVRELGIEDDGRKRGGAEERRRRHGGVEATDGLIDDMRQLWPLAICRRLAQQTVGSDDDLLLRAWKRRDDDGTA